MKKTRFGKVVGLWLLFVALMLPQAGNAEPPEITVDPVVQAGRFVIFYIKNYEDKNFLCTFIRARATVRDRQGNGHIITRRSIVARNVTLPAGSLEKQVEAGKEIIKELENQFDQPRIVDISEPTYSCQPKPPLWIKVKLVTGLEGTNDQPVISIGGVRKVLRKLGDLQPRKHDTYEFSVPLDFCSVGSFSLSKPGHDDWYVKEIWIYINDEIVYFDRVANRYISNQYKYQGAWGRTALFMRRCDSNRDHEAKPDRMPTLVSPADGTVFNKYPRQTKLVWTPVPTAESYTVEILYCYRNKCNPLKMKRNLRTTSYTFSFVGAQPGRWRVWAIYADGRESQKTPWWKFKYLQ